MFIGRTAELRLLEKAYASGKGELAVIYGRRRIGKSALIAQFLRGKPHVFSFEALEEGNTAAQLGHFSRRLGKHLNEPLLEETAFKDWDRAFDYFTRNVVASGKNGAKCVIFLDELQWMAVGKNALVGLLKYYWDNHWKPRCVMLILCGSVSSFMIRNVVRSKALYGRTTLEINLKGLLPAEAFALLGKKRSAEETLKYLLVFGTVPKYLEQIDVHRGFNENMNALCFSKNGIMLGEADKIFHSQFRKPDTYFRIIKLLADNLSSNKEISKITEIESGGGLTSYIENLINADLVIPYIPFNKAQSAKSVKFALCDEFLHFYLKYIKPNLRLIENSRSSKIFETASRTGFEAWLGFAFERFCHKHAGLLAQIMGFADEVLQTGPLFDKNNEHFQIDLIYKRADKIVVVCEIKHSVNEISTTVIPEVERKCALLKIPRGFTVQKALISLYGPDKPLAQSRFFDHSVTIKDIFGE
ncbi:MAG: ATP-binding protein [Chitinivibrionales bacterium]|nr:ATP-binding protein [Chitinivibrionales bacterium]